MNPLVSIVIPTYNRVEELKRAVKSIYSQTFKNWEIIVIDNNSEDNTKEYIKELNNNKIKFFSTNNNGVIAKSRNIGIQKAKGTYLAFLDSDDWWDPRKLEISLKYLNQGASIVYHDLYRVKRKNQFFHISKAKTRHLEAPVLEDLLFNGWAINNSSVVIVKNLLQSIGGLSEKKELVGAEDYDAWLKISKITESFVKIPKTLGYYWDGGGNTSNPKRSLINLIEIEGIYKEKIEKYRLSDRFFYSHFIKGRANYLLGNYDLAKKNLNIALSKKIPLRVYMKCKLMTLILRFKNYE